MNDLQTPAEHRTLLAGLIHFSTGHPGLMFFAAAMLVVAGLVALSRLPFDAFPDTTPVLVQVNTKAPGWSPEEIERQITFPIERELSGLAGLTEVRSISKYALSQVTLIFEDDVDIYLARQQATERLIGIELPDGVSLDSTAWSVCFGSRGVSNSNVVVGLTHDEYGSRSVEVMLGGTTRIVP